VKEAARYALAAHTLNYADNATHWYRKRLG
jgi:hypothetical protein